MKCPACSVEIVGVESACPHCKATLTRAPHPADRVARSLSGLDAAQSTSDLIVHRPQRTTMEYFEVGESRDDQDRSTVAPAAPRARVASLSRRQERSMTLLAVGLAAAIAALISFFFG